ncbi:MAG: rod shape-determining protein RodA [Actinomycetota bacterium]|nr:rod shape-determining protein RodA [Actinomycetota bacterium]
MATATAIAGFGVLMVYAATRSKLQKAGVQPQLFLDRQALWVGLGLVVMVAIMAVDYHRLLDIAPAIYVPSIVALLVVLSPLGSSARGAQRWFNVGSLQLQPSALASAALIVALASYGQIRRGDLGRTGVMVCVGLAVLPMALVAVQPDLGSAIVLAAVLLTMLLVAGARPRHLAFLGLAALFAVVFVGHVGLLKPYQRDRLTAFLDQSSDSGATNYNLQQSKVAIGSGGLAGKGLFQGSQTNLAFVPEQQTDFIFTAVGEQLGFVGAISLLGLFAVLVWRIWRAARLARDLAGTLACAGVLGLVMIQLFENAGMTMGIMPITGIPLPLVSYGGSSTIVTFAALGLVNSVAMHRFS